MDKFYGDWESKGREQMRSDFYVDESELPPADDILFAWYSCEDYSGNAFVLFERDGSLFEVNGLHCSCNGLEDQWDPKPTTWAALAMRKANRGEESFHYGMDKDATTAIAKLIGEHVQD